MDGFHFAAEHEGELNGRQREVLALVAGGRTNAEIADALGLTLDGAKWNVSEILTKLGFASRDEAAAYWRWRNRPAGRLQRAARALLPISGLKLAAGGGALAVAGVAAVVLVIAMRGGDTPTIPPGPFTLTATVEVQPRGGNSRVQWWYQDAKHYRFEIGGPPAGQRTLTGVADGTWLWYDSATETTYQRTGIPDLPSGMVASLPISILLGPANAPDIDTLLGDLRERNTAPGSFARVAGGGTVLGYEATLVEWGPAWSGASGTNGGPETVTSGGMARLWVEPRSMWVLRYESDGLEGSSIRAEITGLDFGAIDPARFSFAPPPGKTLGPTGDQPGHTTLFNDAAGSPVRQGWYAITTLPAGYGTRSWEGNASDANGSSTTWLVHMSGSNKQLDQNPYVRVVQAPSTVYAGAGATGDRVTLATGQVATIAPDPSGALSLVFDDGETRVTVTTNALTRAELIAFAGTLEKAR
ncbi:MAG: helix-turn-helix transcriptional regulator [Dehalococcoidia bacterium]|nr:helix-turn-helix transcriptional regulator [Dehalococcoidia bacterium]